MTLARAALLCAALLFVVPARAAINPVLLQKAAEAVRRVASTHPQDSVRTAAALPDNASISASLQDSSLKAVALPDSAAVQAAPDSVPAVINPDDTAKPGTYLPVIDSLFTADSTWVYDTTYFRVPFKPWKDTTSYPPMDSVSMSLDTLIAYQTDSLMKSLDLTVPQWKELRKADREKAQEIKDSIRLATPRILETYALNDSLYYRRLVHWTHDRQFNELEVQKYDTTHNYHFHDLPHRHDDVDATYLGVSGSPVLFHNYFKRQKDDVFQFADPYLPYGYTPETVRLYNVKTPYTELAYWGSLFAGKLKEEDNLRLMTTQNLTPSFNFSLMFERYGGGGMLANEKSANKNIAVTVNNLGKKYLMNAGWLRTTVERQENGGVQDPKMVLDTTLDARAIPVNLSKADTKMRKNTLFLTHSLAIPMNFFRKNRDSIAAGEGTVAYLGHSLEYSTYYKTYTDQLSGEDEKAFYNNQFFINPTASADSVAASSFDNKVFIKLQPFDVDALLSKVKAGVGYQMLSYYRFDPSQYASGISRTRLNNLYIYAGAQGMFRKYISWDADAKYNYAGYNANDLHIGGKVKLSVYPIDEGIHLSGRFSQDLKRPDWYFDHMYTNHYKWENDFSKISETRIEGFLDIPKWKMEASFGYALVDNMPYYDTLSIARQSKTVVNVMTAYLRKDFKLGIVHLDNKVLFQRSSNQDVLPLPKVSVNLRYYLQFDVVKNVMNMQLGADATFHTAYYQQGYNPALGVFYNQNKELIGGTAPYVDWFVNVQWKRACVFIKYLNGLRGWPTSDYFSAYHYINSQPTFKFGVFWPFYVF